MTWCWCNNVAYCRMLLPKPNSIHLSSIYVAVSPPPSLKWHISVDLSEKVCGDILHWIYEHFVLVELKFTSRTQLHYGPSLVIKNQKQLTIRAHNQTCWLLTITRRKNEPAAHMHQSQRSKTSTPHFSGQIKQREIFFPHHDELTVKQEKICASWGFNHCKIRMINVLPW